MLDCRLISNWRIMDMPLQMPLTLLTLMILISRYSDLRESCRGVFPDNM